jgi:hypothetical protein
VTQNQQAVPCEVLTDVGRLQKVALDRLTQKQQTVHREALRDSGHTVKVSGGLSDTEIATVKCKVLSDI